MAQDGMKNFLTLGIVGVSGYLVYEYMRYSSGIANINRSDPSGATASALEASLPFLTFVMLNLGFTSASSTQEAAAYAALQNAIGGYVVPPTPTPGTTPTMTGPTSVSTTATTTPTTSVSTVATVQQPTAVDLQHAINMLLASADQWNSAYRQLMGAGIDQVYGFSFDQVYGSVAADGTRSSGQLTAEGFLNAPIVMGFNTPKSTGVAPALHYQFLRAMGPSLAGLGAIAQFYTPVVRSHGSMVYRAQHPSPYRNPMTNLAGFTQPIGMEMALYGQQTLRSNKII